MAFDRSGLAGSAFIDYLGDHHQELGQMPHANLPIRARWFFEEKMRP